MWVALHTELLHHPKLARLARYLGVPKPQALGHLAALWCWCAEYAEGGDLSAFDAEEVAEAALREGDAAAFLSALEKAGFIDTDPDGSRRVHNWEEYSGRIRAAREAARERQARHRQRDSSVTEALRTRDKNVTERDSHAPGGEGNRRGLEGIGVAAEGEGSEPPSAAAAAGVFSLWEDVTGRRLSDIESAFLNDLVQSCGGNEATVADAIREAAVSTEKPGLKLVGAIAARMAGPDWKPVGMAKTIVVREPAKPPPAPTTDRRRRIPVSEVI